MGVHREQLSLELIGCHLLLITFIIISLILHLLYLSSSCNPEIDQVFNHEVRLLLRGARRDFQEEASAWRYESIRSFGICHDGWTVQWRVRMRAFKSIISTKPL